MMMMMMMMMMMTTAGLQITVGHWTMADQNLPMSNEMATLVGHFVATFDYIIMQIKFDFLLRYSFECTSVFMSDQIFLYPTKMVP